MNKTVEKKKEPDQVIIPQRPKLQNIITAAVFIIIIFGFFIANILYKAPEISYSERRKLATFTPPTVENVFDKKFMQNFDNDYAPDNFIGRDTFRKLKAFVQFNVLLSLDNNDIYVTEGHAAKLETLNEGSVSGAADKINIIIDKYLDGLKVYYSVIPDKSYFLAEKHGYPAMDYDLLRSLLSDKITDAEYIDLFGSLTVDDYYRTDLHWDQKHLEEVVKKLSETMGFEVSSENWKENPLSPFYGVYYGQSALNLPSEQLTYITSDVINDLKVQLINTNTFEFYDSEVYNLDSFSGVDPYDVFLSGAQPLIIIDNPNAATDKELYIFRDSYSSSLAPLLAEGYSRIVLIDFRYISSSILDQFVEFREGSDALFLYGTLVLNSSSTLLVR